MVRRLTDRRTGRVVLAVGLLLLAIRLLAASTGALAPVLRRVLRVVVVTDLDALGVGWVGAYLLANGSVVAAVSLSLFDAALVTAGQLFMLVVGSRLGAAAIVLVVGAVDYGHQEVSTLRESTRLGLLAFLVSLSVYLPVAAVGSFVAPLLPLTAPLAADGSPGGPRVPDLLGSVTDGVLAVVGPVVGLLAALALILLSMRVFDRVLGSVDTEHLRERYLSRLGNRWLSFALGVVVTGLATSVAFSLGVVVPLYNRGHIEREEMIPYILGANVGTLVDTLVVAAAIGTPGGVSTVLLLVVVGTAATAAALVAFDPYSRAVGVVQRRLLDHPVVFLAFLLALVLAPLVVVVVG